MSTSDESGLPEPENPTRTRSIFPNPKLPEPELFTLRVQQDQEQEGHGEDVIEVDND